MCKKMLKSAESTLSALRLGLGGSIFGKLFPEVHWSRSGFFICAWWMQQGPGGHPRLRDILVVTHFQSDGTCHPKIYLNPFPMDVPNFLIVKKNILHRFVTHWVQQYNRMNNFWSFDGILNFPAAGTKGQNWLLHTHLSQPRLKHGCTHRSVLATY